MMWYLELYLFLTLVVLTQAKLYDHNNHINLASNLIFYKVIQYYPLFLRSLQDDNLFF